MAEPPERKALKNLLVKLKARSIASESIYKEKTADTVESIAEMQKKTRDVFEKAEEKLLSKEVGETVDWLLTAVLVRLSSSIRETRAAFDDLKLYIDALEDSYKYLDETFEKAVYEPARQQAEAMIKEQEELGKKTKPEFYG